MPANRPGQVPGTTMMLGSAESRPVPDPTVLTTQQLLREQAMLRELIETRLNGMDKAIELLQKSTDKAPESIKEQIARLQHLHEEKFASIAVQFKERDTRSERESRDNKVAVDAAFAAQKEAAAKQDEANQKAIDKSEKATTETIKTNAELVRTTTDGLGGKIDDLKLRFSVLDGQKRGIGDSWGVVLAIIGVVGLIAGVVIAAVELTRH